MELGELALAGLQGKRFPIIIVHSILFKYDQAANFVEFVCANDDGGTLAWLANKLGYCDGAQACPVYHSLEV